MRNKNLPANKAVKLKKIAFIILGFLVLFFVLQAVIKFAEISPFLFELVFKKEISLKNEDSRVNILLQGIGGKDHDGPNLTDTIILANLNPSSNQISLTSIPRDLWIPDLDSANKKINTAYAYGENSKQGGGIILAKAIVGKVLEQKVDYAVRIDFNGFVRAVDLLGGIDVNVERTLDDYEYPIEGKDDDSCGQPLEELEALATESSQLEAFPCRYMHVHFDKGDKRMDGKTALIFVRSRHGTGMEGSDFARSNRQEKIIKAFKDKVFSLQTLTNPGKVISLYDILKDSIDTDIKQNEMDDFIRLAEKMKKASIQSAVIDTGDAQTKRPGLLMNPSSAEDYYLQWVLIPMAGNGNFSEIQKYIGCEIKTGNCPISTK